MKESEFFHSFECTADEIGDTLAKRDSVDDDLWHEWSDQVEWLFHKRNDLVDKAPSLYDRLNEITERFLEHKDLLSSEMGIRLSDITRDGFFC